ncbi:hypothetical protein CKM354_000897900 [Cercospora kikuchii]|uniref:Uncharacterized protein n=1 Tax=Cercospora kikuchii TaxID=84275 RepID=A0A9P3FFS3_9PEZI|nr:uncharacterized protein CKM354_000897900 [Cercospora kikuchii]GIZ45828.1 hypothetical protein CKM354_000897900 [Cercospora kikuchii]
MNQNHVSRSMVLLYLHHRILNITEYQERPVIKTPRYQNQEQQTYNHPLHNTANMSTTSTPPTTSSSPLHSIPLAFGLALVPHAYGLTRLMVATRNTQSNAMPRTNLETFKTVLPKDLYNHLIRARGAHLNSLEVFPLYAAAVIAGQQAKLSEKEMGSLVGGFFAARVVYMGLYLGVKSDVLALARTAAYSWSIALPIMALWKAGSVLAED